MNEVKYLRLNGEAVSAILENRKSQMRFALKSQDIKENMLTDIGAYPSIGKDTEEGEDVIKLPYEVGDVIGVKETWTMVDDRYIYRADDKVPVSAWKSSTQMPKEAVRLFLEVASIRVERLQDISLGDIANEGIWLSGTLMPEETFAGGWDNSMSERKREKYGWRKNPWVLVVEFKRQEVQHADD